MADFILTAAVSAACGILLALAVIGLVTVVFTTKEIKKQMKDLKKKNNEGTE